MVSRIELITLHATDLLELLQVNGSSVGSLTLMSEGEELMELDLENLCLVLEIESEHNRCRYIGEDDVVPFDKGVLK